MVGGMSGESEGDGLAMGMSTSSLPRLRDIKYYITINPCSKHTQSH